MMGIFNRNSVSKKVNFLFLVFAFLLLMSFLLPAYWVGRKILEDHSKSELSAISIQKQLTLDGWLSYTESFIRDIANTSDFHKDLEIISITPQDSPTYQYSLNELSDYLNSWIHTDTGFASISIINEQDGRIVVSTLLDEVGANVTNEPYFIHGKLEVFIQNPHTSKSLQKPVIRISLPIQTLENQRKFVISVRIHIDKIAQIVRRGSDANNKIDVYLVNSARQIIVPPHSHSDIPILQDSISSPFIDQCTQGQSGAGAERNHWGSSVISSYTWLPDQQLCLVVEKERQAAYGDIRRFTWNVIFSACVTLILAFILSKHLSRLITKPVLRLLRQVEIFGKGHQNLPIEYYSNDEIGLLSHAFNQMMTDLSKSIEETKHAAEENLRLFQNAVDQTNTIETERALITKLLDTSSSLIIVMDHQGRIIQHNKMVERVTGWKFEDLHGKIFTQFNQSPEISVLQMQSVEDLMGGSFPNYFEQDFQFRNGATLRIAWSSDALFDDLGEIQFVISVGTDITELKNIEDELRKSERNFQTALNAAPISIYTLDKDFRITFMYDPRPTFNQANYLGRRMDEVLPFESGQVVRSIQEKVFNTAQAQRGQVVVDIDGKPVYFSYYAKPITDLSGSVIGLACAAYDITEQKKTEQALLDIQSDLEHIVARRTHELEKSEKILQTMLNAIPEVAYLLDQNGIVVAGNQTLADSLSHPLDVIIGATIYDFFPINLATSRKEKIDQVFATGSALRYTDTRDGRYFDTLVHPIVDTHHQVSLVAVIAIDVTKWKKAEDAITAGRKQMQELTRKVVRAQEEERQRISRELHDEAGQALTALAISLNLYYADLSDDQVKIKKQLSDAITLVTTTMDQIRLLAQDLRPQVLDTMGLNNALEGYCQIFSNRTHIDVEYQGTEVSILPDSTAISLYRFLQEALTNVAKHANANKVNVSLWCDDDILTLKVRDHGIGFEVGSSSRKEMISAGYGIGLLGMKERIEMVGGEMEIHSTPGNGVVVVARVNVNGEPVKWRGNHDQSRNRR